MPDIDFEYELESNLLQVEATIELGRPERRPDLNGPGEEAEDPTIEINSCHLITEDKKLGSQIDPDGLFFRKWKATELSSVADDMKARAWSEYEDTL